MPGYRYEPVINLSDPEVMRERVRACGVANSGGWFWLPCPLCGMEFGGHEVMRGTPGKPAHIRLDSDPPDVFRSICPFCTMAGRGSQ